jgi:hypothetical protein
VRNRFWAPLKQCSPFYGEEGSANRKAFKDETKRDNGAYYFLKMDYQLKGQYQSRNALEAVAHAAKSNPAELLAMDRDELSHLSTRLAAGLNATTSKQAFNAEPRVSIPREGLGLVPAHEQIKVLEQIAPTLVVRAP